MEEILSLCEGWASFSAELIPILCWRRWGSRLVQRCHRRGPNSLKGVDWCMHSRYLCLCFQWHSQGGVCGGFFGNPFVFIGHLEFAARVFLVKNFCEGALGKPVLVPPFLSRVLSSWCTLAFQSPSMADPAAACSSFCSWGQASPELCWAGKQEVDRETFFVICSLSFILTLPGASEHWRWGKGKWLQMC